MSQLPPGFVPDGKPPKRTLRDRLRGQPAAGQPAAPHPAPAHSAHVTFSRGAVVGIAAGVVGTIAALVLFVAIFGEVKWRPGTDTHEGVTVGRTLGPAVLGSLADGFDEAAKEIDAGKPIGEADKALQDVFAKGRKAAFAKVGGPYLSKLVKEGSEPKDDAERKAFADAHRAIARGLRGAKP